MWMLPNLQNPDFLSAPTFHVRFTPINATRVIPLKQLLYTSLVGTLGT